MEAATVAWHPLGWTPVAFSEIVEFPKAILQYRYPQIPNYGDLTKYDEWPLDRGSIDLVVGGTPCQAWSVAGKRLGLDDPRGRVALAYAGLIGKLLPRWIVWENVPGVYSAGKPGGSDFAAFVGTLAKLGYHIAYRTLNAEYFGVPQRRRRCILVGYLGDWRPAAAVLFEPESLRRDIKKGRKKGEGIASGPQGGPGPGDPRGCWWDGGQTSQTLDAVLSKGQTMPDKNRFPAVLQPVCATGETTHTLTASPRGSEDGTGRGTPIVCATGSTAHALTASCNKGATEDGTGRGTPIVIDRAAFNQGVNAQYEPHIEATETMDTLISKGPHAVGVPYRKAKRASSDQDDETWVEADKANTLNLFDLGDTRTTHAIVEPSKPFCADVAPTITSSGPPFSRTGNERTEAEALVVQPQPIAFQPGNLVRRAGADPSTEAFPTIKCDAGDQAPHVAYPVAFDAFNQTVSDTAQTINAARTGIQHVGGVFNPSQAMAVRRLTPEECEALQGFPKGYSRIPWKGKPASECPDGPRYKACGNSMAVPVMAWVGQRIAEVDKLISQTKPEQPKP